MDFLVLRRPEAAVIRTIRLDSFQTNMMNDPKPKEDSNPFAFLENAALQLGALQAKVIPASEVIVENRVPLKCQTGCVGYGKKLTCPPYVPTADEFRKILSEYNYVLLVKFKSPATADPDVICSIYKYWLDQDSPAEKKQQADRFWKDYFGESKNILLTMLELEKTAFNAGCTLALALVNGSCRLCEKCNVLGGICAHPSMARIPEHAVGVNMKKTSAKAGMAIQFPVSGNPTPMAMLLID
jgi:predicted metal-binding protein